MIKDKIGIIAEELFQFSFITYLILYISETVKEGFVTFLFDLNYLLAVVLVSGLLMTLFVPKENDRTLMNSEKLQSSWVTIFSIGGGLLVYYKTQDLGNVSLLISGITAVIIFLLSYLIYSENENTAHKE